MSNRAAAYLQKNWFPQALKDAEKAISLRPDWHKGWSRKGAALMGMNRLEDASCAYRKGLEYALDEKDRKILEKNIKEIESKISFSIMKGKNKAPARPQKITVDQDTKVSRIDNSKLAFESKCQSSSGQSHGLQTQESRKVPNIDKNKIGLVDVSYSNMSAADNAKKELSRSYPSPNENSSESSIQEAWSLLLAQFQQVVHEINLLKEKMYNFDLLLQGSNIRTGLNLKDSATRTTDLPEKETTSIHEMGASKQKHGETIGNHSVVESEMFSHKTKDTDESYPGKVRPQAKNLTELIDERSVESWNQVNCESMENNHNNDSVTAQISTDSSQEADFVVLDRSDCNSSECRSKNGKLSKPASPIQSQTTEDGNVESVYESSNESVDGTEEYVSSKEPSSVDFSDVESTISSDIDDDDWMSKIEEARRLLGANGSFGFVPPPPSKKGIKQSIQSIGTKADTYADGVATQKETAKYGSEKLDFQSLQDLLFDAAIRQQQCDPTGTLRFACKQCGVKGCSSYQRDGRQPATIPDFETSYYSKEYIETENKVENTMENQCGVCGCHFSQHETESEAQRREERERVRRQRSERNRKQMQANATTDRERRLAAVEARKKAADENGEVLHTTNCDMLNQAQRGKCTECSSCPGFCILYRVTDALDPEVMLFCSLCGCGADAHPIDPEWAEAEERRKEKEQAAAARFAAARAAASSAAMAARREELEAYDTMRVPYGADERVITKAWRRLCRELHPDKQHGKSAIEQEEARQRFLKIQHSYTLLLGKKH